MTVSSNETVWKTARRGCPANRQSELIRNCPLESFVAKNIKVKKSFGSVRVAR